ncbi:DNA polymerase III subunit beta [Guggenheimella bovis]
MKFTVNQAELIYALNILSRAISTKTTLEVLKGIFIEAKEDHIVMKSNDLSMSIIVTVPAVVERQGSTVIESRFFNDIVRKLPEDGITIEKKDDHTSLVCFMSHYKLMQMDESTFPQIKEIEEGKVITINQSIFSNMIRMTNFAVSRDETRPTLTGSLIEVKNNEMKMVSIDGFNIAIKKVPVQDAPDLSVIIPGRTLSEIQKITAYNVDDNLIMNVTDNYVSFTFGNVVIISKVLEGEYIKYEQVISSDFPIDIEVDSRDFYEAIDRAALMANQSRSYIEIFDFADDKVTITSQSEMGTAMEEVDIRKNGSDIRIGFNPNYLIKALRVIDDEVLRIRMSSPVRPCFIQPKDNDSYEYYLVPIRINQ